MRPSAEQLQEIAALPAGELAHVPFPVLLLAFSLHRRTAVLELERRQVKKTVFLEDGAPVDCRSNLVHETLGRFLVRAGALGGDALNSHLSDSLSRGVPIGEILVEKKVLGSYELFRYLQQNLAHKLLDLFTWKDGSFRVQSDAPPVTSPLKVKVPQLLLTGLLRFAPQDEVDFAVAPLVGRPLAIHPRPHIPLADLRLSEAHTKAFMRLAAPCSMGDLAQASGLPFGEITRLVYALSLLGAVAPSDEIPAASSSGAVPAPARATPAVAAPPPPPAAAPAPVEARGESAAELSQLRDRLMEAYLKHRQQDAFDILGVDPEAALPAIQDRFLAFAEGTAPWRFVGRELDALQEKARELFLAGAAALGALSDPEQRNILRSRRMTLLKSKAGAPPPSSFAIKTDLLDPQVQFQKGKTYMEQGKLRAAIQEIEFASDCDPQNGLYRAELAWCRYLESPSAGLRKAMPELEEAVRIDPQCGLAWFYGGQLLGELERFDEAEDWLRKANKLLAPDRRPLEALRELATKRKKK